MASRPKRSAATKANKVITAHAQWANNDGQGDRTTMSSRRSGRATGAAAESPEPRARHSARGAGRRGEQFEGGEIVHGTRNRGGKKSYVVDSSPDDDEEEEEDEIELGEEMEDDDDDDDDGDAEGEDEMDVDAEGDEDAEGDIDMDAAPAATTIRVSRPGQSKPAPRASASKVIPDDDDDDDDDLSDPGESEAEDTLHVGDDTMADEDAEGEEIEVAGEEDDEEEDEEEEEEEEAGKAGIDSDEDGSRAGTPDLNKMTKRQRARFEEEPQQYMKLSDEVQAKKVFTAEELSMRRQEMARRRRNLSDKRNEEVKMETVNKLLKKQAPKINKKAAAAAANAEAAGEEANRPSPAFVRWVSTKAGNHAAASREIMDSPAGTVFGSKSGKLPPGKMVEEVA